jgi:hypothetical protein
VTALAAPVRALRYELVRLAALRETRAVILLALLAAAVSTLPAARQVAAHPPSPGAVAWVVAAGRVGLALPAPAAAFGAAWFGASAVSGEYRHRGVLLTFAVLPRRGAVLIGRLTVAALFGALLCAVAQAVAYGTARAGFALAARGEPMPLILAAPRPLELATAAGCGLLGVLAATVLRVRLLAVPVALTLGLAAVAAVPGSASPARPVLVRAARDLPRPLQLIHQVQLADAVGTAIVLLAVLATVSLGRRRAG